MGYHYDRGGYSLHGQKVALEMPPCKGLSAFAKDCRSRSVNGHLAGQILVCAVRSLSVICQLRLQVGRARVVASGALWQIGKHDFSNFPTLMLGV